MAFDPLDEPTAQTFVGLALVSLLVSLVSLIRSWRSERRSCCEMRKTTAFEPTFLMGPPGFGGTPSETFTRAKTTPTAN